MNIKHRSPSMATLLQTARRYAQTSATILISGESGTGKEMLAQLIHQSSSRSSQPLVSLNCAAMSSELIESELFGHEPGAFTGANTLRIGKIEAAGTGTVFLDEVSEISRRIQAKMLRMLEEHEFQRVGGNQTHHTQARFIAATNRCLEREVAEGRFRQDLFHRLNVLRLEVPPLRDRIDDIPVLVEHFLHQYQHDFPVRIKSISPELMRRLCAYHWPGNVRQLRNIIYRASILAEGDILQTSDITDFTEATNKFIESNGDWTERMTLDDIERRVILQRLRRFSGNKDRAAAALGVTSRTLRNKVRRYRELGQLH